MEYQPHEGDCCECVPRLRQQNKESSDKWTQRTAKLQSRLDGLQNLMDEAQRLTRVRTTTGGLILDGLSQYGQAAIATALKEADEAVMERETWKKMYHEERRARVYIESRLATSLRREAELRNKQEIEPLD